MVSVTARFAQPAVGPQLGLSKTKDSTLSGTFRNLPPSLRDLYIVFGTAATPPATYADINAPQWYRLEEMDSSQFTYKDGTAFDGSFAVSGLHADGTESPGDQVYVCLFSKSDALAAGDVPIAIAADGLVTA